MKIFVLFSQSNFSISKKGTVKDCSFAVISLCSVSRDFSPFQDLTKLEDELGIKYRHIRLLAKSLTLRRTGYNNFTL